jgi:ubiquinone/menaquinone biosynthesis C-methylase UbiE
LAGSALDSRDGSGKVIVAEADVEALAFEDRSFDLVVTHT